MYRLLLIDDNPDLLKVLSLGLVKEFDITTAQDGIEGLEQAITQIPDCIVVDVRMPGLDGYQVVRALRGDPSTADIPLIILTALIQDREHFKGLASGADEFLVKPIMPSQLIPIVHQSIKRSQADRERAQRTLAEQEPPPDLGGDE
jgi:two-component system, OmpR family, alkaline phosphatase synthesis response regulator PhoP